MVSHFYHNLLDLESSVQLKEEKTTLDVKDKFSLPEDTSTSQVRSRNKLLSAKQKGTYAISGVEGTSSKKSKLGRDSKVDINTISTLEQQPRSDAKAWKRKRKSLVPKVNNEWFLFVTQYFHLHLFSICIVKVNFQFISQPDVKAISCSSYRYQVLKLIWILVRVKL